MQENKKDPLKPNFILYDVNIPQKFAAMCQQFQKQNATSKPQPKDWVIIDNTTGEVIFPENND